MNNLQDGYKTDIIRALDIWKEILREHGSVKYAYVHGSALKQWESDIDYVPFISDVDLHIYPEKNIIFDDDISWEVPIIYEDGFVEEPYLHLPRINIKNIKKLIKIKDMIFFEYEHRMNLVGQPQDRAPK